jgi:hypothetical protein
MCRHACVLVVHYYVSSCSYLWAVRVGRIHLEVVVYYCVCVYVCVRVCVCVCVCACVCTFVYVLLPSFSCRLSSSSSRQL